MSGLHADTGAINANGKDTVANAEYYQNELASLRSNVENLMSIWRGKASTEFNNTYEEQDENFKQFQQLLNDLGEKISQAANTLNTTEEENASAASRLFND